jgi:hypothetical protein
MKKSILIDTSSAILLFKSRWMAPLLAAYQVGTGPTVFQEMTVPNHPGADTFRRWQHEKRLILHAPMGSAVKPADELDRLDPGERECIRLYYAGRGRFIVIDDGPGAAFCRREAIPYVNALLVPRLLARHPLSDASGRLTAAIRTIYANGRYAPWVLDYVLNCSADDLSFFLP